jgi:hypothetical protein
MSKAFFRSLPEIQKYRFEKKREREREREKMLWVDKHRPKSLKALDYHKNLAQRLMGLVSPSFFFLIRFKKSSTTTT